MLKQILSGAVAVVAMAAVLAIAPKSGYAADYPTRPVKLVVPFAPGGGADNLARLVAPYLSKRFGHEFVIENRGGGGSSVGSIYAIQSGGDGYTLLMHSSSAAINLGLYGKLPYDLFADLKPISLLASGPVVLVAHPSTGVKTLDDLIKKAKGEPGKLNFATGGNGSPPHLATELLMMVTGIKVTPVHYKGSGPATTDVLGGHVGYMFSGVSQSREHIEAGKLIALGVTGAKRIPALPSTPTMAELGQPQVSAAGTYWGLLAPKGTSDEIVNLLNAEVTKIMQEPALVAQMEKLGYVSIGSTPKEYTDHIKSEVDQWAAVAKSSKITPQ